MKKIESEYQKKYSLCTTKQEKLEYLLKISSRTFSLSILEIKDSYIRKKMTLAYLICRVLDTIEDDTSKTISKRKEGIKKFIQLFEKKIKNYSFLYNFGLENEHEYKFLLSKFKIIKEEYEELGIDCQKIITNCVVEMGNGMIKYLENKVETYQDYEEYCYYVAGTVAILLNDLHYIRFGIKEKVYTIHFAYSLQKTNIILDISDDAQNERWFLPTKKSDLTIDKINFYVYDALKSIYESTKSIVSINELWNSHKIATTSLALAIHSLSLCYNNIELLHKRVKIAKNVIKKCVTEDINKYKQLLYDAIHLFYQKNENLENLEIKKKMDLLLKKIVHKMVDDNMVDSYKHNLFSNSNNITDLEKMNSVINKIIEIREDELSSDMYTLELKKIFTCDDSMFGNLCLLKHKYEHSQTNENLIKLLEYGLKWVLNLEKNYSIIDNISKTEEKYRSYIEMIKHIYTYKKKYKEKDAVYIDNTEYNIKVDQVKKQIKDAYQKNVKVITSRSEQDRFITRSANYLKNYPKVKLNGSGIIEFDEKNKTIKVEPRMTIGEITKFLFQYKLSVGVVPELKLLTVGGLVCGAGAESTSWKYGIFFERVKSYDIVFGNGEMKTITKRDPFFRYLSYSYGTLGLVTSITFDCIDVQQYVKVELIKTNFTECENKINEIIKENKYEYIDGLVFSKENIILMLGNNSSEKGDEFIENKLFYKYIKYTKKKEFSMKYLDYCFRYDLGTYWYQDQFIPTDSSIFRKLIHEIIGSQPTLLQSIPKDLLLKNTKMNNLIAQDSSIPLNCMNNVIDKLHKYCDTERYPLWLCPLKFAKYPLLNIRKNDQLYINVGFYNKIQNMDNTVFLKKFEEITYQNYGFTINYSEIVSTKEEYYSNQINYKEYLRVRKEYNAENTFPEIYDKLA